HRDHVAPDAERRTRRLDVSLAHRTEEARAGLDRRRAGGTVREIQVRAQPARTVRESHQRAAVEQPARGTELLAPLEARADFLARRLADELDAEQPAERHRGVPVHGARY